MLSAPERSLPILGGRPLKRRVVPDTLFQRSLLIVILPILILQLVLAYIFYNRTWDSVTRFLSNGVAGEVAVMVEMLDDAPTLKDKAHVIEMMRRHVDLAISFEPHGSLANASPSVVYEPGWFRHIDEKILEEFRAKLSRPFIIDLRSDDKPDRIAVYVQTKDGLLRVLAKRRRVTSTTSGLLFSWMTGASAVLAVAALYFMRLQIRPIRRLVKAVDSFGKGRDIGDVRPAGAMEIRLAARAFNRMRARILRHIGQRTEMLAAVSHDLRTPLTRMKLELELMDEEGIDPVLAGLRGDVGEMSELIETYLAFARDEGQEAMEPTLVEPLLVMMRDRAERAGSEVELKVEDLVEITLRPLAFRRALANLVDNAARHGKWIRLSARCIDKQVEIAVEDDGPGIPEDQRGEVLQPFVRLEQSRSKETGGLGLGLTIARDVILGHGGDLDLETSSRGGLRAVIRLPL